MTETKRTLHPAPVIVLPEEFTLVRIRMYDADPDLQCCREYFLTVDGHDVQAEVCALKTGHVTCNVEGVVVRTPDDMRAVQKVIRVALLVMQAETEAMEKHQTEQSA